MSTDAIGHVAVFRMNPESKWGVIAMSKLPIWDWHEHSNVFQSVQIGLDLITRGVFSSIEMILDKKFDSSVDLYAENFTYKNFGECILLAMTKLKSTGYLTNKKCVFTIERVSCQQNEKWLSRIESVRVAGIGQDYVFCINLFWLQGSIIFNREDPFHGSIVSVQVSGFPWTLVLIQCDVL